MLLLLDILFISLFIQLQFFLEKFNENYLYLLNKAADFITDHKVICIIEEFIILDIW